MLRERLAFSVSLQIPCISWPRSQIRRSSFKITLGSTNWAT
jgi:hypothetical protein